MNLDEFALISLTRSEKPERSESYKQMNVIADAAYGKHLMALIPTIPVMYL